MELIKLEDGFGVAVMRAAGALRRGGIVLYPTDTLYGLGADAFSDEAVAKMHAIKGSDPSKPTHCIVADIAMAEEYAEFNDAARAAAKKFLPGPFTLILKKKGGIESGIARGMDTIGIRIPAHPFCVEVAAALGRPFTATSANKTGAAPQPSIEAILAQLGGNAGIDLCIDAGVLPRSAPSTIVNLVSGNPVIVREGAVPASEVAALFS